jgi:hypothetical protein
MAEWKTVPAHTGDEGRIYVYCRQCRICEHIGINDEHETDSCCSDCDWSGPAEKDQCPSCSAIGTMSIACPECGGKYDLLADADLVPDGVQGQVKEGGDGL